MQEKFKYFISYVDGYNNHYNCEIIRDTFIESMSDIKEIEKELGEKWNSNSITITNYRIF